MGWTGRSPWTLPVFGFSKAKAQVTERQWPEGEGSLASAWATLGLAALGGPRCGLDSHPLSRRGGGSNTSHPSSVARAGSAD